MTILAPLLIWLAKQLIQHFLATNIELKKELEASVKRYEDYQKELAELTKREMQFDKDIAAKSEYLTEKRKDIISLNRLIDKRNEEYANKLKEAESIAGQLSDDDVLHHEL
jgi:uncharacterized protein (DUF342 family)